MNTELRRPLVGPIALPFYYGWVNVFVAALAMVGTLPGRTQGLGLITEPLLADLQINRVVFARINLWATLIGALFCLGVGRLIDRFGSRIVLTIVTLALATVVLLMSGARSVFHIGNSDHTDARTGTERPLGRQYHHGGQVVRAPS